MTVRKVRSVKRPIEATIRPPGSKSETIRALAVAGLADGRSHLYGALRSDDSDAMVRVLRGFGIGVEDRTEPWAVEGTGGYLTAPDHPIDVGESGLSARIGVVLAALAEGTSVITGRGRLPRRPFRPLVEALRHQGVDVVPSDGGLPMTITGQGGLWGGLISVDCRQSSQFATALLIGAPMTTEPTTLRVEGLTGSAGYLEVTSRVMGAFGARVSPTITGYDVSNAGYDAGDHVIEPDASAGVYPMVAAAITGGRVRIDGLSLSSPQPDIALTRRLVEMGCDVSAGKYHLDVAAGGRRMRSIDTDMSDAPDASLALLVAAAFAEGESRVSGLHSLRLKESDRIAAMKSELGRLGAAVSIEGDRVVVRGGELRPATIDPHGDHRIAMACALAGLVIEGVEVMDAEVVNKTWPGYWEMLDSLVTGVRDS